MVYDKDDRKVGTVEGARILNMCSSNLRKLAVKGEIPAVKVGSCWQFSTKVLEAIAAGYPLSQASAPSPKEAYYRSILGDHHDKY